MKLFENKIFVLGLVISFIVALLAIYLFGCFLGLRSNDIPITIINAILMLISTGVAVSLPLYASYRNTEERKNEELKIIYRSVALYVGNEILDNVIEIEDLIENNRKTFKQVENDRETVKYKRLQASIWKAACEELDSSLDDKCHLSMVKSGLIARVPDEKVGEGIRYTYQLMDNLRKRLRRGSIFFGMLLNPPFKLSFDFEKYHYDIKLPEAIDAIELDIKIFMEEAERTRLSINKLLKPYGKQIRIMRNDGEKI